MDTVGPSVSSSAQMRYSPAARLPKTAVSRIVPDGVARSCTPVCTRLGGYRAQIPLRDTAWLEGRRRLGLPEAAHEDLEEPFGGAPVLSSVVGVELGHGERTHTCVGE
jgi:hypothetical protein